MQLNLSDILLSNEAARAVCWTLVHSLWEGMLAAALAGVVIGCTRRLPAALRYNLLAADLLLFLLVAGATFSYEIGSAKAAGEVATAIVPMKHAGVVIRVSGRPTPGSAAVMQENFIQRTSDYLNAHAAVVTLIWMVCLSAQLLRLTGGLYQVGRLRRKSLAPAGAYWTGRLSELAVGLGIKRTVTLLQSGLVKAPAALGFLKPSILVPIGLLANLPADQVETILLHELAHIRRGDYVMNLLLHFTEALFFFNPGIRWIAALMRREREACCDDIVLAGTPDRNSYFDALLAYAQFAVDGQDAGGMYALSLGGGRTDLLWRIRRMLERENKKLQIMEKTILSFGLMVLVSISLISMRQKDTGTQKDGTLPGVVQGVVQAKPGPVIRDTTGKHDSAEKKVTIHSMTSHSNTDDNGQNTFHALATDGDGNQYEVTRLNGRMTGFKVNGTLVQKEEYGRYWDVLEEIEAERENHSRPIRPIAPMRPMRPMVAARALEPIRPIAPAAGAEPVRPIEPRRPVESRQPIEPRQPIQPVRPDETERPPSPASPLVYTKHPNPYIISIVADLLANQLLPHLDRFSFTLDTGGLVVNGVKLPEDIAAKFTEKYVRKAKDHFIYSQYYTPGGSGSHCEVKTAGDDPSATTGPAEQSR